MLRVRIAPHLTRRSIDLANPRDWQRRVGNGVEFVSANQLSVDETAAELNLGARRYERWAAGDRIYPDLSPVENLRVFGRLHGLRGAALAARIDDVVETTGLTDRPMIEPKSSPEE